jgi:hypothetical protein
MGYSAVGFGVTQQQIPDGNGSEGNVARAFKLGLEHLVMVLFEISDIWCGPLNDTLHLFYCSFNAYCNVGQFLMLGHRKVQGRVVLKTCVFGNNSRMRIATRATWRGRLGFRWSA